MAKPRVVLNLRGIRRFEHKFQPQVDAEARRRAAGYEGLLRVRPKPRPGRAARAYIEVDGVPGIRAQARDHILERVIGS